MAEEDFEFEEFEEFEESDETEPTDFDFEDEFDRLREKTARTSAVYDDMELDEEFEDDEPQGFFSQITPGQRLILLVLLLLDIVVIAVGAMAALSII